MGPIHLAGGLTVMLRRSDRARRMVLRVSRSDGAATVTLPARASEAEARAFVLSREAWLLRTTAAMPTAARVIAGAALPVAGQVLTITPAATRVCRIDGGALLVPQGRDPGPVVAAWLRERARAVLVPACERFHAHLPAGSRAISAIALRDTRSRWGSCTAEGRLMFNWRLAMAPPAVLDYVVAHEVAHLARMDHSPAFWAVVARLDPGHAAQRAWLRQHGGALQAWRFRGDG